MLSNRERTILRLVVMTLQNKEIAARLGLEESTVKVYISNLCKDLSRASGQRMTTRMELMKWGMTHPAAVQETGKAVAVRIHPPGCPCDSPYCSALRCQPPAAVHVMPVRGDLPAAA